VSALVASVIFASGVTLLVLSLMPGRPISRFVFSSEPRSVAENFRRQLRAAGIFDRTPSLLLVALASSSLVLSGVLWALFSSFWAVFLGPPIVIAGTKWYLLRGERRFLARATSELIPFLNRITTQVRAGRPAQQAYLDAVADARLLRDILSDSAAKISTGARLSESLLETLELLPLRMWSVFVRQLELYEKVGGDIGKALETTTVQVNQMLQLQAEARADYAIQKRQQQLVILIAIGSVFLFAAVGPGLGSLALMFTTTFGLVGLVLGLTLFTIWIWFLNLQLRDVERKLAF
jgi:Flp pilus assembly protein TadB